MSKIEKIDGINNLFSSEENSVKGYVIVDVRRPDEFTGDLGHIKGAQLVTLGPELMSFISSAPKTENYLFVCRSGGRSTQACMLATANGIEKVTNLYGGMLYWNQLGLKTDK